ncbi:hypothetical protein V5P93_000645 [Actinokineospora auranticolor]|uniref:Transglycosylase-like protein with SLT domain n=1 Tax=Actinokineospora auranticolor TaxID=155976 RepID=A0A2S6GZ07_9PSEU|nr:hypothetical protein [Actinokineospora auranticolor]PPK70475.1 hypothetical protein CLV40_102390 [Actinokineospora auranticolor]
MSAPTTTTAGTTQVTGQQAVTSLNNDVRGAKAAIERGDWLDAGLQVTNVAMDVINIAGDPLGAAAGAGFGWIIQHIKFLREPFDKLLGDANSIISSAQGWVKAGDQLVQAADKYRQAVKTETCNWQGAAGDSYRRAAATQAEGLDALAEVSKGVGEAISGAGKLLAEVRKTVLDFINKCVQKVIMIIIEALAKSWLSFGASIAEGIAKSVAQAVQTAQKVLSKVQKFVSSLQKILQTVQKIVKLAQAVKQLLETIGGKASGGRAANTRQAPAVNTSGVDTAANTRYTNPNPTSGPTYTSTAPPSYNYTPYQPPGTVGGQPTYNQGALPTYTGYQPPTGGTGQYVPSYPGQSVPGQVGQVGIPGTGPGGTPPWGSSGPPPTQGAPASRVDRARWIGAVVETLINHGVDPSKINAEQIAQIVDRTSGGNPHAVTLPDPNGGGGLPSKGMVQITDPVFDQHKVPGYDNIWEPVDNMLAGVRYFLTQWGSLLETLRAISGTGPAGPITIQQQ